MREASSNPTSVATLPEPTFSIIDRQFSADPESIATELQYHCELLGGILGMNDPDELSDKARYAAGDLARAVGRSIQDLMTVVRRANEADLRQRINELTTDGIVDVVASLPIAVFVVLGQRDRRSPEKDQRMQAYYNGYGAAGDKPGRVFGIDLTEPVPEAGSVAAPAAASVR